MVTQLLTLIILGLAAYRATHLVVHDSIGEPIRDRITGWYARKPESKPRILLVISCAYCAGWWISGAMLAVYLTTTGSWNTGGRLLLHGVEWFTVAGVQALANRWNDTREASA